MATLSDYKIVELLYESSNSRIYLGEHDHAPLIVKVLQSPYPTPQQLVHFNNEYEFTKTLNIPGIRRALQITEIERQPALLLEYVPGETLKQAFVERRPSLNDFLKAAIQIAQTLGEIHQHQVIHKDINAHNILFEPHHQQIKIIDFGISSRLNLKCCHLGNPDKLEGTLAYISPEQTGRMNRMVDYRTDLYSLGVTFYEMLTGQLPFTANDPLELVHAHLAKNPRPPHQLRPDIPEILSQIILKLMAKNAENRYQSAFGLKYDLERYLELIQSRAEGQNGLGLTFELAQHDFSSQFQIPQKLYGREREIEVLLGAFDRVASVSILSGGKEAGGETSGLAEGLPGRAELMLVAGYAGVGKTILIQEIHKPITEKRGYFIEGKFDRFQRNIPYYAWVQAFKSWVNLLLTENETVLARWKDKILSAVGDIGQVLLEVIPNLELIIGPQPPIPELGGIEAQNRFTYLFQNFIRTIAQPDHPLVIFIDDWQWADTASLNLFKLLMSDADLHSLLLVCAYRDNEVDSTHPFRIAVEELRQTQAVIGSLELRNLSQEDVHALVADTLLNGDKALSAGLPELSDSIYAKTLGNAFFVNEFLKSLYAEELLQFDFTTSRWAYDLAKIKTLDITDNVVELLAGKILKLPAATQELLKLAACIGNKFEAATLGLVAEENTQNITQNLTRALQEGLIYPDLTNLAEASGVYKFAHDRIQQAAYSLIPDQDRRQVHLKLGRLLLQHIPIERREECIFEIVNQLNFGVELLEGQADRIQLAELNLIAGQKAKASSAYQPAFNYLQTGLALLEADSWQTHYRFSLALHTTAAETAYLNGDAEAVSRLTETILHQAADILDKVKAYQINIATKAGQNLTGEAIGTALECLEQLLGLTLPQVPTPADIQQGLKETMSSLAGRQIEELFDLPLMTNPYSQVAMDILISIAAVAYRTDPRLVPLIVFKMIHLSLTHGNTKASTFAYVAYGFLLCSLAQDIPSGYRFGQLSLQLLERLQAREYQCKVVTPAQGLVLHWQEAVGQTLKPLLAAYQIGLETGDLEYAAASVSYYACHAYFAGAELPELVQKLQPYTEALLKFKQTASLNRTRIYLQTASNLIYGSEQPGRLLGEAYHEDEMLAQHQMARDITALCHLYTNKMILNFLFENYPQARTEAAAAAQYLNGISGQVLLPVFCFYDALIQLANYNLADETEQPVMLTKVVEQQQKLERWAKHAPMNHLHKFYLIEAERRRVLGEPKEARDYYDLALQAAREHGYINEEALIAELAGKFYLARGDTFLAEVYLRRAYQGYQYWGALAKVRQLEVSYPQVLRPIFSRPKLTTISTTGSGDTTGQFLDIHTILKASQTMAGQVDLSELLAKMIKIVVENAGAEQGFLLLEKDKNWCIEAEYHTQDQAIKVLQSIPMESVGGDSDKPQIPNGIINFVVTTRERVVLDHAAAEGQFNHLPYIKKKQTKSVLCLPLLHQGKLAGVLYLENNLTTGAFTPARVELLNLLTSQMAVSIENARLYADLQQSEKKYRTIFEDSRDMIFISSPTGEIVDVNPACLSLLGYSREEFMQMKAQETYTNPADRLRFQQEIEAHGSVKDLELKLRRRDGAEIDVLMTATLRYAEDGTILGYQGIIRDITAQKQAEQERLRLTAIEQELNLARNIQQSLLPPAKPTWADLEVVCYSTPARTVGGDFYAYHAFNFSGNSEVPGKYALALGDVTGKGMPAALLMAVSLASFRSVVGQGLSPTELLAQMNQALIDYTRMTYQNCALVYIEIELQGLEDSENLVGATVRLANAGGIMPLVKFADGTIRWVEIGGVPLGTELGAELGYQKAELSLAKGDLIILTSDGLVEANNADNDLFGFERLEQAVKSGPMTSAEAMLEYLKTTITAFVGETEAHDDLTMVVVRV